MAKFRSGAAPSGAPETPAVEVVADPTTGRSAWAPGEPAYVPPRIAVNMPRLREMGYLPEEGEERRFADYYRAIKRPLIQKAFAPNAGADLRLILVTSALPGEGKTFTSLNLALSMARERDISVLLVDGDFPKAEVGRALGVQNEPGILDALADETRDVDSLVLHTDVRGLEVLPAGTLADGAAELIASGRMTKILAWLTARHPRRLMVWDSAPLLITSEGRALAQLPSQLVLVARCGHTPRQALLDALGQIDKNKLSGLVLNDGRVTGGEGYYYGYSSYGSRGNETSRVG